MFNDQTFGPGRLRYSTWPGFPNVQNSADVNWYGDRKGRTEQEWVEDMTGYSIPPYRDPLKYAHETTEYEEMMNRPGVVGADFSKPPVRPDGNGRQKANCSSHEAKVFSESKNRVQFLFCFVRDKLFTQKGVTEVARMLDLTCDHQIISSRYKSYRTPTTDEDQGLNHKEFTDVYGQTPVQYEDNSGWNRLAISHWNGHFRWLRTRSQETIKKRDGSDGNTRYKVVWDRVANNPDLESQELERQTHNLLNNRQRQYEDENAYEPFLASDFYTYFLLNTAVGAVDMNLLWDPVALKNATRNSKHGSGSSQNDPIHIEGEVADRNLQDNQGDQQPYEFPYPFQSDRWMNTFTDEDKDAYFKQKMQKETYLVSAVSHTSHSKEYVLANLSPKWKSWLLQSDLDSDPEGWPCTSPVDPRYGEILNDARPSPRVKDSGAGAGADTASSSTSHVAKKRKLKGKRPMKPSEYERAKAKKARDNVWDLRGTSKTMLTCWMGIDDSWYKLFATTKLTMAHGSLILKYAHMLNLDHYKPAPTDVAPETHGDWGDRSDFYNQAGYLTPKQIRSMKSHHQFSFISPEPWGTSPLGVKTDRWQLYSIAYARTQKTGQSRLPMEKTNELWAPRFQPGYNPPDGGVFECSPERTSKSWQTLRDNNAITLSKPLVDKHRSRKDMWGPKVIAKPDPRSAYGVFMGHRVYSPESCSDSEQSEEEEEEEEEEDIECPASLMKGHRSEFTGGVRQFDENYEVAPEKLDPGADENYVVEHASYCSHNGEWNCCANNELCYPKNDGNHLSAFMDLQDSICLNSSSDPEPTDDAPKVRSEKADAESVCQARKSESIASHRSLSMFIGLEKPKPKGAYFVVDETNDTGAGLNYMVMDVAKAIKDYCPKALLELKRYKTPLGTVVADRGVVKRVGYAKVQFMLRDVNRNEIPITRRYEILEDCILQVIHGIASQTEEQGFLDLVPGNVPKGSSKEQYIRRHPASNHFPLYRQQNNLSFSF